MISKKKQDEIDYWVMVEEAARTGIMPNHDCKLDYGEHGCQICIDYHTAREWWVNQSKQIKDNK
jgi:hypothetical protein